ncbi:MAG: acyl--CoA ligase [Rhodospirillaceae bacterium]|nr:acyl--CoA ligase [Rhodospirillaceae bacterium]MBT4939511.1 acyl--CoA ligase [Rhodospirillaceae bacterium]MBT7268821.1 acyl--CoA ligase [Rhodospirillaceae bacterium]
MNVGIQNRFQEWLKSQALVHPEKTFIRSVDLDADRSITYRAAYESSCRIGQYLKSKDFQANDRVALMSNNSIEHLLVYIGVMAYGATVCTIHVEMNALYIDEIISSVKPKVILFEEAAGLDLSSINDIEKLPLGQFDKANESTFYGTLSNFDGEHAGLAVNSADDIASIFYTSGTSSKPKGVMYSFGDLTQNAEEVAQGFDLSQDDRMLDFRSFNWMSAQVLSALGILSVGATLLLARKFSSSNFFNWIKDHRATIAAGNPTTINMLINRPVNIKGSDIPHLRYITSSSAPLLIQDWQKFENFYGIDISQGYGSSETGWIAASHEKQRRRGSVGKPLPYQNLTIVNGEGETLPAKSIGDIELGPRVDSEFKYLGEDGEKAVAAVGRVKTGDMGYLDGDGFLFVSGRQKDLIIRGGINISPLEIENVILAMPGIAEVAALGIDDEIYGEDIVALVVLQKNAEVSSQDVINHCKQNLSDVKLPRTVRILSKLPKTDRGKLDRKSLKELWSSSEG